MEGLATSQDGPNERGYKVIDSNKGTVNFSAEVLLADSGLREPFGCSVEVTDGAAMTREMRGCRGGGQQHDLMKRGKRGQVEVASE